MIEIEMGALIAVIAGIALPLMLQTAGIVWWASSITLRIRTLEHDQTVMSTHGTDLAVLKTKIDLIERQVTRVVEKLDA